MFRTAPVWISNGAKTAPLLRASPGGLKATISDANIVELLESGRPDSGRLSVSSLWSRQGWTRACVSLRADALSTVPYTVSSRGSVVFDSDEREALPPPLRMLTGLQRRIFLSSASMALEGAAYFFKPVRGGLQGALQWVSPQTITMVPGPEGPRGFRRRVQSDRGSSEVFVSPDDLLYMFVPDPYREQGPGSSDAESTLVNANVLHALASFSNEHLTRGLVKAFMVTAGEQVPPPGERERIKAGLSRLFSWWRKKNSEPYEVFAADLKVHAVGEGFEGLSNVNLSTEQREAIATAFRVPHSLVMSNETGAKATSLTDRLNLYDGPVTSDGEIFETELNAQLLAPLGYEFHFEWDRVRAYREAAAEARRQDAETALRLAQTMQVLGTNIGILNRIFDMLQVPEDERALEAPVPAPTQGNAFLSSLGAMDEREFTEMLKHLAI